MPVGGWSDRVAPALRQVHAVLGPQRRSRLRRRHRLLLLLGLQQELHLPVERVLALDLLRLREIATWLVEADWEAVQAVQGGTLPEWWFGYALERRHVGRVAAIVPHSGRATKRNPRAARGESSGAGIALGARDEDIRRKKSCVVTFTPCFVSRSFQAGLQALFRQLLGFGRWLQGRQAAAGDACSASYAPNADPRWWNQAHT